ncbi:MAG: RNA polymerase sigma-70 factor [Bacteroidetes bacterium]|nr:RNA polymerase sigma-70 factor [Bacteroidota bacterium]
MGVKKIQIANRQELEELFKKHYHFLCTAAYYITGDESTAKDIVQDFFYYCWKKREEIIIAGEFKSYASRAIRNACLNYLKSSRRTSLLSEFVYSSEPLANESVQPDEEGLEERNKALWASIDRLPEQRRLIFLLSNKEELSYAEIARRLGISVNTVKTQIRLAYQYLREECRWLVYFLILLFL